MRWMRLRVRPGRGLIRGATHYTAGDEFVVSYADAARLLKGKGLRVYEIIDDFQTEPEAPPPEGTISLGRP
jgi:hypothetical protein